MGYASKDDDITTEPLSPDYEALSGFMRQKFGLSEIQATRITHWLETEYDAEANAELYFTYFEWLARFREEGTAQDGKTPPPNDGSDGNRTH